MPTAEYADLFDLDSDASGDPILVDPVSGDTMFTWDRSEAAFIPATIGTAADPVPGTSHFVNTEHESVSTDNLQYDGSIPFTITVRSSGGDASTLEEAIALIPKLGIDDQNDGPAVTIDLEAGATYTANEVWFKAPWASVIRIIGDGTNPPTIETPTGVDGFKIRHSVVRFLDVDFTATDADSHIHSEGAWVRLVRCNLSGTATRHLHGQYSSWLEVTSGVDVTSTDGKAGTDIGIEVHSNSHLRFDGTVSGIQRGIVMERGATGDLIGCIIDDMQTGILLRDAGGPYKLTESSDGDPVALTNCDTGVLVDQGPGYAFHDTALDTTGTTEEFDVNDFGIVRASDGNHYTSWGYSWQDVTASRTLGVQQTNDVGADIKIKVGLQADAATDMGVNLYVNGSIIESKRNDYASGGRMVVDTAVPKGATYEADVFAGGANTSLNFWREYRP